MRPRISMLFAFLIILFFAIEILFITEFTTLGMTPMNYTVAAIGIVFLVQLCNYKRIILNIYSSKVIHYLFCLFVLVIILFNIFTAIQQIIQEIVAVNQIFIFIGDIIYTVLVIFSLFLLILIWHKKLKSTLNWWMVFSIIFGTIGWLIKIIFGEWPKVITRYSGVFDLGMLFGWFMIIFSLIKYKYEVESFEQPELYTWAI